MNIPAERVLTEIERHLENARPEDAGNVRETLSAIRALCDIVLSGQQPPEPRKPPAVRQLDAPAPAPAASPALRETPLQEDDANGDSLFDF
ncbi:YwdI family protein [Indiicoccus explosivorum]|uniref:YwdI family protein n=1 Tax=Indiicoccus explosivorum TaxID=1917864 RepID=UPI000B4485DD|nr:YwdI family protein [Indiicoccus explosivorum]